MLSNRPHLLLIDASGFAYRAFHGGLKFPRYRDDGLPTGAILGFLEIINRLLGQASADPFSHVACIFDAGGNTFRHDIFPEYKANRSERDPELTVQLPIMRDAARSLGLPVLELAGYEADDIIATLARRGAAAGWRVTIVSSDKDMGQLVIDNSVEIVDPFANRRILEKDVMAKWGVPPRLVQEVQALCGDSVDNIPGVDGIGEDTAAKLIRKLGDLGGVMAEAQKRVGYRMTASVKLAIQKAITDLPLYLRLTTLETDVPLAVELADLIAMPLEKRHLEELLRALDAKKRFAQIFERPAKTSTLPVVVPHDPKPLAWHGLALVEAAKKLKSPSHRITLGAPDDPQAGWYKRRLVKAGPWVPAKLWRERAVDFETDKIGGMDNLFCVVGGIAKNAAYQWGVLLNNPITEAEYEHMMRYREWVKTYGAPGEPEKAEDAPIDWNKVPI